MDNTYREYMEFLSLMGGGKRDIAGKYTKHESAEKVLEKIITTYKNRTPDENTVFYIAKEEE